jgi:hypothetical protein
MVSPGREGSRTGLSCASQHSAKGPVSRILSCAVIPLDAALPRTFSSDLPGGSGNCLSRLGASGRCATPPGSWRAIPSLFGLAPCGVYLDPSLYRLSGALLPHHFTLTPALEFRNDGRTRQAGPTRVLRFQGGPPTGSEEAGRGSRGGIFSVALAVHGP